MEEDKLVSVEQAYQIYQSLQLLKFLRKVTDMKRTRGPSRPSF